MASSDAPLAAPHGAGRAGSGAVRARDSNRASPPPTQLEASPPPSVPVSSRRGMARQSAASGEQPPALALAAGPDEEKRRGTASGLPSSEAQPQPAEANCRRLLGEARGAVARAKRRAADSGRAASGPARGEAPLRKRWAAAVGRVAAALRAKVASSNRAG